MLPNLDILFSVNVTIKIPNRSRLKYLVNANRWQELGVLFNFTPQFHFGSSQWIDWRCVPQGLVDALRRKPLVLAKPKPATARPRHDPSNAKPFRRKLYDNQNGVCHYCNRMVHVADWTIDHRLPSFRGGQNTTNNKIGCCKTCNGHKSCLTEEEFFALHPGTDGIGNRCKAAVKAIQCTSLKVIACLPTKS